MSAHTAAGRYGARARDYPGRLLIVEGIRDLEESYRQFQRRIRQIEVRGPSGSHRTSAPLPGARQKISHRLRHANRR